MQKYDVKLTHQAIKDVNQLTSKLRLKLEKIITEILERDPYEGKRLIGELAGSYSLRLSYKDRVVYSIDKSRHIVYIERAKTHDDD